MGSRALRRLLLGQEATAGVPVAATTVWGAEAESIENTTEFVKIPQDIGRLSSGLRFYAPFVGGQYEMPETIVTFEQICHILQAGLGAVTASNDGTGRVRQYGLPKTAAITPKTYTLQAGDDTQAYRMAYSFVTKFKVSGKLKEPLKVEATWVGRERQKTTFTTGISVPANLSEVMFGNGRLYIDDSSIGSTQKLGTFLGFDLEITPGIFPRYAADGNLYFAAVRQGVPKATLSLTFEHDATGVDEQDRWEAEALRLLRMEFRGPALGTAGSTYTTKLLRFDLAGKWTKFSKLGEDDGANTVTGEMAIDEDVTSGVFCDVLVVNEDNAIP